MLRLTRFEMKKLLDTKLALLVNIGVLLLLGAVMTANIVQQRTYSNTDTPLQGTAAIEHAKEMRQSHEGTLTAERVVDDVSDYRAIAFREVDPIQVMDLSDSAAYDLMTRTYEQNTLIELYDPYYSYLLSPWHVAGQEPYQVVADIDDDEVARFYDAVAQMTVTQLDNGMGSAWIYSDAERAFWIGRQAEVLEPFDYGYAGGWSDILDCLGFLVFAMLGICVTLASVFAGEYQARTDSVLLASRYGRSKLVGAKVVASFLYASVFFVLSALIICCIPLVFFGVDGAALPIQNVALSIPYDLTMSQAVFLIVGVAYVMTMGFVALTLLLSSHMHSTLGIFVIDMVLIVMVGMIPPGGNAIVEHIEYLLPYGAASASFKSLLSYPFGPIVFDLPAMIMIVYLLLIVIGIPASAIAFRRHQVV